MRRASRRGADPEPNAGPGGGYRLSRPPRDIVIGDIIRRLEGRLSDSEGAAPNVTSAGEIAVRIINRKLTEATDQVLEKMTLEDLMEQVSRSGPLPQAMYYI
jgi:DNA-binding IscR family transcriptional regulator